VEQRPAERQLFLNEVRIDEEFQSHGLASAILVHLRENTAPGTTLRLYSTNIETNQAVAALDEQLFGTLKPEGRTTVLRAKTRSDALTQEVRRLLREGPREAVPLWVRALDNAGWKDVEIEVSTGGYIYVQGSR
jgi:hypothetical protein